MSDLVEEWQRSPQLPPGESETWSHLANLLGRVPLWAEGGRLVLTQRWLVFAPNRIEHVLGRRDVHWPITDITGVHLSRLPRVIRWDRGVGRSVRFVLSGRDSAQALLAHMVEERGGGQQTS